MIEEGDKQQWLYIDSTTKQQRGPVPALLLLKLLEKSIITNLTYVWKPSMTEWLPISSVEPFQSVIAIQWYYIDSNDSNNHKGPYFTFSIIDKFKKNEICSSTLMYSSSICKDNVWCKVQDIDALKDEIFNITHDHEEGNEYELPPVISGDINVRSHMPLSSSSTSSTTVVKKTFTADNGMSYTWDDTSNDEATEEAAAIEETKVADNLSDNETNAITAEATIVATADAEIDGPKKKRKSSKKSNGNWIYITGLPSDITVDELKSHFCKVGLIEINPIDQEAKIKIYTDSSDGTGTYCKGDASLCYHAKESVQMAINVLSEGYIRPTHQVTVAKADFNSYTHHRSSTDDATRSTCNVDKKGGKRVKTQLEEAQLKVARNAMKQQLTWNNESDDSIMINKANSLKIIVIEGMFQPADLLDDSQFEAELEEDVASECSKYGEIEKITLFSNNPKGILVVKFATSFAAHECMNSLNGRNYNGTKIKSYYWDGVTNYSVVDTRRAAGADNGASSGISEVDKEDDDEEKRIDKFGQWLESTQDDLPDELKLQCE